VDVLSIALIVKSRGDRMNDQCTVCKIRKWCYRDEPQEDFTCDYYKSDDDYVDFLDEDKPEKEKQELIGY